MTQSRPTQTEQALLARIDELEYEIGRLSGENERLSTDAVTGISGRGVLDRAMDTDFARARRYGRTLALVMIDIDHFKAVNDTHGHRVGDDVLFHVAQTIRAFVRGSDTLARYGGEEFAMVLDGSSPKGVELVCERIRDAIERLVVSGCPRVTISIGWSLQEETDENAAQILQRADAALYVAKANGRNRVEHG